MSWARFGQGLSMVWARFGQGLGKIRWDAAHRAHQNKTGSGDGFVIEILGAGPCRIAVFALLDRLDLRLDAWLFCAVFWPAGASGDS